MARTDAQSCGRGGDGEQRIRMVPDGLALVMGNRRSGGDGEQRIGMVPDGLALVVAAVRLSPSVLGLSGRCLDGETGRTAGLVWVGPLGTVVG
jgi:hypothetical protein